MGELAQKTDVTIGRCERKRCYTNNFGDCGRYKIDITKRGKCASYLNYKKGWKQERLDWDE